jgi:hypothetical protein
VDTSTKDPNQTKRPYENIADAMFDDAEWVTALNAQDAIKSLNEVLTLAKMLMRRAEGLLADFAVGDHDNAATPNSKTPPESLPTITVLKHELSSEVGDDFRAKEKAQQLSYAILAFFQLKSGQPIGLTHVSNAMKTVFGNSNSASLNTKMNRWKEQGILQWSHTDRRAITPKGREKAEEYGDLIDPAEKARIDRILERK